jgi:6,7-dimethyl-8-ribityllumazine synthase
MQNANHGTSGNLDGDGLAIGIVQARFNADITDQLAQVRIQGVAPNRRRLAVEA